MVPGSVTLLAGDPGVGKSTLLLKVAHQWAAAGRRALYVSGEESRGQIRMRADRTGCSHDELYLAADSDLHAVLGHIEAVQPTLVVVDSVQTMASSDTDGVAGGVTQVRAVTAALTAAAKTTGVPLILIGHVTKDGAIAGPRSLEHLVDVVLHFEGDRNSLLRMVRGVKNGSAPPTKSAVSCCRTTNRGCCRSIRAVSGSAAPTGRGNRDHGDARRQASAGRRDPGPAGHTIGRLAAPRRQRDRPFPGRDDRRGAGEHCRLKIAVNDVYLSTVGGMRLTDPSSDLPVAVALASAYANLPMPATAVMIGEVGLAGDLRRVGGMERRLAEAAGRASPLR